VILLPAVDIRDGKAVRLVQGDFARETVYNDDPLEAAKRWVEQGARSLHVVDLDGALQGKPANLEHLKRIIAEVDVPVQYGGGLRDSTSVREALAAGADRVVIGTAAYTDQEFLDDVVGRWGSRVIVAVDVRGGHVSVAGWTQETQGVATHVIDRLQRQGVRRFAYTNVDRDGTLEGPDIEDLKRIAEVVRGRFIYSGGIGSLDHLRALAETRLVNLAGVIAGKSLYEGKFTIEEAHAVLDVGAD
jgi:phosphoribosylformimino-5-aminoimidazole carboxamide ribotide isomerase